MTKKVSMGCYLKRPQLRKETNMNYKKRSFNGLLPQTPSATIQDAAQNGRLSYSFNGLLPQTPSATGCKLMFI